MTDQRHPLVQTIARELEITDGEVQLTELSQAAWQTRFGNLPSGERKAVSIDLIALALELGRVFPNAADTAIKQVAHLAAVASSGRDGRKDPSARLRKAARSMGISPIALYSRATKQKTGVSVFALV